MSNTLQDHYHTLAILQKNDIFLSNSKDVVHLFKNTHAPVHFLFGGLQEGRDSGHPGAVDEQVDVSYAFYRLPGAVPVCQVRKEGDD